MKKIIAKCSHCGYIFTTRASLLDFIFGLQYLDEVVPCCEKPNYKYIIE